MNDETVNVAPELSPEAKLLAATAEAAKQDAESKAEEGRVTAEQTKH